MHTSGHCVKKLYANAAFWAGNCERISVVSATRKPRKRKRRRIIKNCDCRSAARYRPLGIYPEQILDFDTTLGYPSRFQPDLSVGGRNAGGVAQLGERLNGIQEVRGSIPLTSMASGGGLERLFVRGNSSVGRAQPCQGWGRGFESRFPLSSYREGRLAQLVRAPR